MQICRVGEAERDPPQSHGGLRCASPTLRTSITFFVSLTLFGHAEWGLAQRVRPLPRVSVSLETPSEAVKRLATVEDHVKERQWAQAILILHQAAADYGEALIAVSPRRYVNVRTHCNSILANLPAEGLKTYRDKYDAQAQQWLETGLATRDAELLEKIVRQSFVSRSGDDALFWLGEWAWSRGDFASARDHWRQLVKLPNPPAAGKPQPVLRYPDSEFPQAEILARIVLCHIMEGNKELAESWLTYLTEEYPDAEGELAGQQGVLTRILKAELQKSRGWHFPESINETPTFAGNAQRNFPLPKAPEVGGVQWELPLPDHHHDAAAPKRAKTEPALSYYPVVAENTVFVADPDRIFAFDLLTGEAKWPSQGVGKITDAADLGLAAIYQSAVTTSWRQEYRVGVPRFSLTVHHQRLYARMGSPITEPALQSSTRFQSHLVCLDLTKEGKLVWSANPEDALAGTELAKNRQWAFEGTPVVEGGRVFAALRQSHPETRSLVACLDAETGKPLWTKMVATPLTGLATRQNFLSHLLLTLGENMVFFMPEYGVITALDAENGRLLWAVTYPSAPPKESPILQEPRKQGLTPCVFHQGVVYAAPTDSESLLALSANTGVILWERKIPFDQDQIRHVLGVVKNRLVVSGNELWILNATTGKIEFPTHPAPGRHPEFDGYGRGLIAGETIFWPTRSKIEIRNLAGQRVKQPKPHAGGNLAAAGDLLLLAEPRRLVAFSNFAQVRETQRKQISENPKAGMPHWRLAQVEEASGEMTKALKLYDRAITLARPSDQISGQPLKRIAQNSRFRLLIRLANTAESTKKNAEAITHFREAFQAAFDDASRAEALRLLGGAQIQAGQLKDAVRTFQGMLQDPAFADLKTKTASEQSYHAEAKDRIAELIQTAGRAVYAEFDREAARQINARLNAGDLKGVQQVIQQFPNAAIHAETRHHLARLKRDQGEIWAAIWAWQSLLKERLDPKTRQAVYWELAGTLEKRGYFQTARETWRTLKREFPQHPIPLENTAQTVSAFVTEHLQSSDYLAVDQTAPPFPLMQHWERKLPQGSRVILPMGDPPGLALACVLLDHQGIACVDRQTGKIRWQKPINDHATWAGYAPTHLVLGTNSSLLGVMLETGETLWQVSLGDADEIENFLPQLEMHNNRIFGLRADRVFCRDANTGGEIWMTPLTGEPRNRWHVDAEFIALQTKPQNRIVFLDALTGKMVWEKQTSEPWTASPKRFHCPPLKSIPKTDAPAIGFVVALGGRTIRAFGAINPTADPKWTYHGAASFTNAQPWFTSHGTQLVMLMDGDTLIKLNPQTGESLWDQRVSHDPIPNPDAAIVMDDRHLYAAEQQTISCRAITDGKLQWQRLVPKSPRYCVHTSGKFLIAAALEAAGENSRAMVCETRTGQPVQELQLPAKVHTFEVHPTGAVAITNQKLVCWGAFE